MLIVLNPNDYMGKNEKDAPAGYVVRGMENLRSLYKYNDQIDNPSGGEGPDQGKLQAPGGDQYLKEVLRIHFANNVITNHSCRTFRIWTT